MIERLVGINVEAVRTRWSVYMFKIFDALMLEAVLDVIGGAE